MTTYRRIKAVYTSFDILEYLSDCREPVTGSRIAQDLAVPFQTVMCHLATAQDRGYVQVLGDKYKLGMKLAVFWARVKTQKETELHNIKQELAILHGGNQ